MESNKSGHYSDYKDSKGKSGEKQSGQSQGNEFGSRGEDPCLKAHGDIQLEDISSLDYFIKRDDVPPQETQIYIDNNLIEGRLVAKEMETDIPIGLIPTKYNFILSCIESGFTFTGSVSQSRMQGFVPVIKVDIIGRDNG